MQQPASGTPYLDQVGYGAGEAELLKRASSPETSELNGRVNTGRREAR